MTNNCASPLVISHVLWDNNSTMSERVEYWLELCDEDLLTAKAMFQAERYLPMGFYCHMIAEKALKAVIAKKTNELPPKIHDLRKLAVKGDVFCILSDEQKQLLFTLDPMQIETRYPDEGETQITELTSANSEQLLKETEEFLCWIRQQLEK